MYKITVLHDLIFSSSSYLQAKRILKPCQRVVVRTDITVTPQHAKGNHYSADNGVLLRFGDTTCCFFSE